VAHNFFELIEQSIVTRILFGNRPDKTKQSVLMECVDNIIKGLVSQMSAAVLGSKIINYLFIWQNNRFNRTVKQFVDFAKHTLNANGRRRSAIP
jgi:hypothetical protein